MHHSHADIPQPQPLLILRFLDLKPIDCSTRHGSHHHLHFELIMSRDVISMVMRKQDIAEGGMPFGNEVQVGLDVEDGINQQALFVGLDVVWEDSQLGCFELGDVVALAGLLAD